MVSLSNHEGRAQSLRPMVRQAHHEAAVWDRRIGAGPAIHAV